MLQVYFWTKNAADRQAEPDLVVYSCYWRRRAGDGSEGPGDPRASCAHSVALRAANPVAARCLAAQRRSRGLKSV